jgi:uncharacterized protein (UPF0276 family)
MDMIASTAMQAGAADSLPLDVGIGLKPQHYEAILAPNHPQGRPAWVEVHPQNYFGDGGPPHRWLTAISEIYPTSFHSVGLSLGSAEGLMADQLDKLSALCERYRPAMVSDHLSFSGNASPTSSPFRTRTKCSIISPRRSIGCSNGLAGAY